MGEKHLGIIMHGVTGRMGTNQHLVRSILAIRAQGGVLLANGDRVMPDPILVGRNADKLALKLAGLRIFEDDDEYDCEVARYSMTATPREIVERLDDHPVLGLDDGVGEIERRLGFQVRDEKRVPEVAAQQ